MPSETDPFGRTVSDNVSGSISGARQGDSISKFAKPNPLFSCHERISAKFDAT
jgi:hypothetical protein